MNYYYYKNEDAKKTIVLLHGWGVDSSYMNSLKDYLKKYYSILLVDLPGHGKSKLSKPYKIQDYIDELFFLITKENIKSFYGIGHSFGGKILSFYALKYKIDGGILIAPSSYKSKFSLIKFIKIRLYKVFKLLRLPLPKSLRGSRDYINAKGYKRMTFLNVYNKYLKKKELRKIKTPFVIMGFEEDAEIKKYQLKKLRKYLFNSKLYFYKGNHFSYFDYYKEIRLHLMLLEREKNDINI